MAEHAIETGVGTLHGHFSRDLAPVLVVEPGDRVRFSTLDGGWGAAEQADPFSAPRPFEPRDRARDPGHALTGPVAVRGARPGSTLVVHVEEVRPGSWGWTSAGGFPSPLNQRLGVAGGPETVLRWALDPDAGLARDRSGRTLELRPFMGVMGMPPGAPGIHSTIPPRRTGGNIDCRELVAGSTLYLPIEVEGALFSTGDGHGLQGDGEVAGLALECPMERVVLGFDLEERALAMPRAWIPGGWVTFGFHEDLDEATIQALDGMLDLMTEHLGLPRREALALASLAASFRITQIVNGVRGVHAFLPDGAVGPG